MVDCKVGELTPGDTASKEKAGIGAQLSAVRTSPPAE